MASLNKQAESNPPAAERDADSCYVDVIDSLGDLNRLRTDWERVYRADPEAQFFLSWQWIVRVCSAHPKQWLVLAVSTETAGCRAYSAFLPLRLKTSWNDRYGAFVTELRMAGTLFWSDYTGLLCSPEHEAAAIPALGAKLKSLPWCELVLKNLRISPRRLELFTARFHSSVFRLDEQERRIEEDDCDLLVCPYVDLPEDFDTYLSESLSSNTRQKIRRFLRKVEQGDEYRITLSNERTRQSDLDILERLWQGKWAERKGQNVRRLARSYREIVAQGVEAGAVFMPVLWKGDSPLGVVCSFVDRDKREMLFFVAGRDEACSNPPPGLVLHAYSIRWAIENGIRRYDFLRGDERYKYSFGVAERRIRFLTISMRSGQGINGGLDRRSVAFVIDAAKRYQEAGRTHRAEMGYRQVLQIDANDKTVLRRYGRLLYGERRYVEAEAIYRRLVAVVDDDADAWRRLGRVQLVLNDFRAAERSLRRAIALASSPRVDAHYYLGCALHGQDRGIEAERAFAAAASAEPTHGEERQLRAHVLEVRDPNIGEAGSIHQSESGRLSSDLPPPPAR